MKLFDVFILLFGRKRTIYFIMRDGKCQKVKTIRSNKTRIDWFGRECFCVRLANHGIVLNDNPKLRGYGKSIDWLVWRYEK